ncbi:Zinc finger DNA binding protein [Operophtera brumata]|uniref:Zinc finger DNA binding protein n=1 Tax=Operophtera brumata TaxID=104452 RepID=A0A0L7L6I7_OPEBR|nr:Zinc finger DNA binding protein [Operophtera brumata]
MSDFRCQVLTSALDVKRLSLNWLTLGKIEKGTRAPFDNKNVTTPLAKRAALLHTRYKISNTEENIDGDDVFMVRSQSRIYLRFAMKCSACGGGFNDGVQCGACKKHLDFGCAQMSKTGWRKLGNERRAAWKCSACRSSSPASAPAPAGASEPASLEAVLKEVKDLRRQLVGLPTLIQDVKSIKDELKELKSSCDFANNRLDGFAIKIAEVENRVTSVEQLQATVVSLETDVSSLKSQLSAMICKATNYSFPKTQINYLHRVPLHGSKEKAIVVSFINRYVKEEFVASARACKTLSAAALGFTGTSQRVFVNDHLNAESKNLLNKTKSAAKEKNFNYVWVKYGKIHVRKNETSPAFIVYRESDLNKFA